jgi:hypothetical protein
MLVIEKILLGIHKVFNTNSRFNLRKQYLHLALYSPSYVIEHKLPIIEKEGPDEDT